MIRIKQATKCGWIELENGGVADLSFPNSTTRRGRVEARGGVLTNYFNNKWSAQNRGDKYGR